MKLIRFYGGRGLRIVKAKDQYVWDVSGRKYLDTHTCHGVAFLGHSNEYVIKAIEEQLRSVDVASPSFDVDVRDEAIEALSKVVPRRLSNVALLNSGSEAVEFALKLARRVTRRRVFVAFTGSFHGRTFGALSITWNPRYREPFKPLLSDVRFCKFNDVSDIDECIREDVAAVVMELIQGEGGVYVANKSFVKAIEERVREVGALLIVDEVQTGFGRTGKVWAIQHYGVEPDIMTAGKALGGGFPVSAVFTTDEVVSKLVQGDHGSTYGGNPLACAAIKAATYVLRKFNVPSKALIKGNEFISSLKDLAKGLRVIRDVRGLGLMIGAELRVRPSKVLKCMQDKGILALKAGVTVVRFLPPYMISSDDIRWCLDVFRECVEGVSKGINY